MSYKEEQSVFHIGNIAVLGCISLENLKTSLFCRHCLSRSNIINKLAYSWLGVWPSGSALVSINEVTLRRAPLELGWVTGPGVQLSAQETFLSI